MSGAQTNLTLCLYICRLKCDRVKPCITCTRRGQPELCEFLKQDFSRPHLARPQGTTNVYDRVRLLEDMVKTLLNNHATLDQDVHSANRSPSATNAVEPVKNGVFSQSAASSPYSLIDPKVPKVSLGKFTGENGQINFVGSEHWEAILEDITELKIDLETADTSRTVQFKPQLLFGVNSTSRSELMASIPSRSVCDMLISRWCKTMDMAPSKFTVRLSNI
jgi:hypothetical protein